MNTENTELQKYLDEKLHQLKSNLDQRLEDYKKLSRNYLSQQFDVQIENLRISTEQSKQTYIQIYNGAIVRIKESRQKGMPEKFLSLMEDAAKKSLSSGLEFNENILLDYIEYCKKLLNQ